MSDATNAVCVPVAGFLLLLASVSHAGTLRVGPGGTYALPSEAIKAARDGDVIEIDAAGRYEGDVTYVNAANLTIRGVGQGRALLDAKGKVAGRKGIFVTRGNDITIENVEFRNAGGEVNAAGIRAEGRNLTIRNCRFHECRDAILGGAGEVLIERSEFSHCGHNSNPATHNLYMSERVTKLVYRYNYSHHSYEGHLLKSRAAESWLLYNRLTDEQGEGSAVADFPNGGLVVLIGNVLHKGPRGHNNRMVVFGMEGLKHARNELYVVNNTMWWDNRRPDQAWFVRIEDRAARPPAQARPDGTGSATTQPETRAVRAVIRNNLCIGPVGLSSRAQVEAGGNLLVRTMAEARLVDGTRFDFRPAAGSPVIDQAIDPGKVADFSLAPDLEYVHPANQRKRPAGGKPDIGAFERAPDPPAPQPN